jgi:hypothetical protein
MTEEVRFTDPSTGAQKGRKPEALSLLPYPALASISRVYNYGASKYAAHNWRAGMPWSWSYDALQRHLGLFWEGQDLDDESGLPHLAHAGFHVFSLLTYQEQNLGTDDRYKPEVK